LGKIVGDVWKINMLGQNDKTERTGYDTQKPKKLLERIVDSSSNKEDIVADFFMGSGTTGEVALELGRKFIGCDIGERACEITKNRLDKIII
jgi:DNA modification methylase